MPRDHRLYPDGTLMAIAKARAYTSGMHLHALATDDKTVDPVLRTLEVIDEAAETGRSRPARPKRRGDAT